jgi:hypothetical protein
MRLRPVSPPNLVAPRRTFNLFHQPVAHILTEARLVPQQRRDWSTLIGDKLRFFPAQGQRYAVLFSGASNNRHVNDLEFLYRMLIDVYDFAADHIYVLNYDGTINYTGSPKPVKNWPGDQTAYRMPVNAEGTKSDLENVLDDLKNRLRRQDLLFIHTNNHGGHDGNQSYLCTYSGPDYLASDFADKLSELPPFAQLFVMMEQCHSGGFNDPIIHNSTADQTTVASACEENRSSIGGPEFDPFARDWIAAMNGTDPYGAALAYDPNTKQDGVISAIEAFSYADTVKDPYDTPVYSETPVQCGTNMHLGRPEIQFVLSRILDQLKYYEMGPVEPVPPGPYVYEEVVRRIGAIEKVLRPPQD